jgi:trimethyllysine dioxygenase
MDATEAFARRIGFVLETIYGHMWTTRPKTSESSYNDTASTNVELRPHTDCTYLYEPPGLQIFNCIEQAKDSKRTALHSNAEHDHHKIQGGASRFVDGFAVVTQLRKVAPEAFDFFTRVRFPFFHCVDHDMSLHTMEPMIRVDEHGDVMAVRLNDYDRAPWNHLTFEDVGLFYVHQKQLWSILEEVQLFR